MRVLSEGLATVVSIEVKATHKERRDLVKYVDRFSRRFALRIIYGWHFGRIDDHEDVYNRERKIEAVLARLKRVGASRTATAASGTVAGIAPRPSKLAADVSPT